MSSLFLLILLQLAQTKCDSHPSPSLSSPHPPLFLPSSLSQSLNPLPSAPAATATSSASSSCFDPLPILLPNRPNPILSSTTLSLRKAPSGSSARAGSAAGRGSEGPGLGRSGLMGMGLSWSTSSLGHYGIRWSEAVPLADLLFSFPSFPSPPSSYQLPPRPKPHQVWHRVQAFRLQHRDPCVQGEDLGRPCRDEELL
jgi:hypothetical protein